MYRIKQSPEDFIVKEISNIKPESSGIYSLYILKKTNYTTLRAIEQIARSLKKPLKDIGFAGTKDRKAVTEQLISIKYGKKEKIQRLNLKDIQLRFLGYSSKPVSLGDLEANEFIITIKNLKKSEVEKLDNKARTRQFMPNYFGEQRFSKNNIEIGRNIVKSDYKAALRLITESNSPYQEKILSEKNNYIAALRVIPKKLLLLYIHAYQSFLWNRTLSRYLKTCSQDTKIPIIGFGTELEDNTISSIIGDILRQEKLTFRDFINKKIPELSSEGSERAAFTEIGNLKILEKNKDSVKIQFTLQKGSYATVTIASLLDSLDTLIKDFI